MLKAVSCTGTSKIFEISVVHSLLLPIPCLKTFFIFFGDQIFESAYFAHICHKNNTFAEVSLLSLFLHLETCSRFINFIKSNFA